MIWKYFGVVGKFRMWRDSIRLPIVCASPNDGSDYTSLVQQNLQCSILEYIVSQSGRIKYSSY